MKRPEHGTREYTIALPAAGVKYLLQPLDPPPPARLAPNCTKLRI